MAAAPYLTAPAAPPSRPTDGILIGDRLYSDVYLTIDNSIIPEERLSPTPSMVDGLDLHMETDLRILGCELIQSAGILLRMPQVAMATGQVLFHRFFFSKSFVKHSFEIVAMACMNLASKIEESPRRIRDVINIFHHLRQLRAKRKIYQPAELLLLYNMLPFVVTATSYIYQCLGDVEWYIEMKLSSWQQTQSPLILDQGYINTKNQVIKAERRVLKELGFCVHVKHPHKIIVMYLQVLECERNPILVQTAWNFMNDCLRTNVFVRFEAETIACACIYLAARVLQIPLPNKPHWFLLFGATEESIQEICVSTLRLYSWKKPNYDLLDKEVEKRKVALQEAKLKAKGLNPDGTPALSTMGGFSPASKPSSPREVKAEEKSPVSAKIKREPEEKQSLKSPYNGLRKEGKRSRSVSRSRSRTKSRSRSPRRHYNNRRSRSGTYSSRSRSRSRSHSESPRRHHNHASPHLKLKHRGDDLRGSNRHGHKRKKSHSPTPSKSREHGDPSKKHRHDRGHHRDRRERSRSFERSHKSKHHGGGHSGHSRHRR